MSDVKKKSKGKKGKLSKQQLLNLLDKYKKGLISHDKYMGILIKHDLHDPAPMEAIRNHRNEINAAEFNNRD